MKKFLLISLSLLLFLILAASAALYLYVTPERLEDLANRHLEEQLEAGIGSARFNLFTRTLHLEDVTFMATREDQEVVLFQTEYLTAGSIGLLSAVRGELSAGSFQADRFMIDLTQLPTLTSIDYSGRTSAPIDLGTILLKNGELRFPSGTDGSGTLYGLQVAAGPISYRPDHETEPGTLIRNLDLNSERFEYQLPGGNYQLSAETISVSERDSSFKSGRIRVENLYSEQAYFSALDYRTDLIEFDVDSVSVTGLDLGSYLQNRDIVAGLVRVENADLHVTSDKRIPRNPDREPKPLPRQILLNLPFVVSLDTIQFRSTDIRYSEYDEEGVRPGTIHFADTDATLLQVNNRTDVGVQLHARSLLNRAGALETEIRMYTENSAEIITVAGTLGEFDLTRLNSILMDLEGIEITGGTVRDLRFDYRMSSSGSMGTLQARYDGFTLQKVSRDDHSQNLGDQISTLANRFMMRSSSASNGEEVREGSISAERDPEKSFFNYLWVSLRSGLLDVAGRL